MAEVEELPPARLPEEKEEESTDTEVPATNRKSEEEDLKETLHLIEEATGQKMLEFKDDDEDE